MMCLTISILLLRGEVRPGASHDGAEGGVEVQLYSFCNLDARWGGWSTPRPGRFTPWKKETPVHIVLAVWCAPGPVCKDAGTIATVSPSH